MPDDARKNCIARPPPPPPPEPAKGRRKKIAFVNISPMDRLLS